jgi:hypothetical protein
VVNATVKARLQALEVSAGSQHGPYELWRGSEAFRPTGEDDGIWAVKIGDHLVEPEAGESVDQLCRRAVALHADGDEMPVLSVMPSDCLLTTGVGDEQGPLHAVGGSCR